MVTRSDLSPQYQFLGKMAILFVEDFKTYFVRAYSVYSIFSETVTITGTANSPNVPQFSQRLVSIRFRSGFGIAVAN